MTTDELNAKIEELCEAKGMTFKPWEVRPWWATAAHEGPCPWPAGTVGAETWPKAVALRRKLIAELLAS